jgi:hypothetical protein
LNDDGTASMATALMMSHHGLRRDLARFSRTLRAAGSDPNKTETLREAWESYHATLHGHHQAEDNGIFPSLKKEQPTVAATIDKLASDHLLIDPLLESGDRAFAGLPGSLAEATRVVDELEAILGPHLALEEAEIVPFLRGAKSFPAPASDAEAEMYAKGFAWAMHGIHPNVLEKLDAMLPEALKTRLPAARAEFDARAEQLFGPLQVTASTTPIPGR